jgi:hypothetical protein
MRQTPEILQSWKEISDYLRRGVRTVQRWERDYGLPVRRPGGQLHGSVFALALELDEWTRSRKARAQANGVSPNGSLNGPGGNGPGGNGHGGNGHGSRHEMLRAKLLQRLERLAEQHATLQGRTETMINESKRARSLVDSIHRQLA